MFEVYLLAKDFLVDELAGVVSTDYVKGVLAKALNDEILAKLATNAVKNLAAYSPQDGASNESREKPDASSLHWRQDTSTRST